ncbi:Dual specificity protein phosphatase 10 [Actinomortierella ambigua]|uniref:Dual specificity protein phosphatase 10 n=1 Tax=Actinomortierella ambigua TaxID=1343610 RepID=A0A9P6PP13_9FUNG|nr:Dual specificity protein phosphatase 10 [Actinomortierella ambigua]
MTLPWSHGQRNLLQEFPAAFAFIDDARSAGTNVLVHCQLGVSRSASLVIAYVMRTEQMNLSSAYEFVKDKSGVISPNMSLMYQLVEYEKSLPRSSDSQQQDQQQLQRQPPLLRRSDSDSVVVLETEASPLSRRPSTNGKKSSMVIHPTPRSPLRPQAGSTHMTDISVPAAATGSRPTSPYQRVRPSTSSTSLTLTSSKSRPASLLCLPDQSLTQQLHHNHQRQPEAIAWALAKYPPTLLAPASGHADPVPSSSDMELTEEEDEEEERDKFPASMNRFSASPSMSSSSRAVSMISLSPPSSRPISTSESVMTGISSSHSMAMDCDIATEPLPLITPMPRTPTIATMPTSFLTTTKPKTQHHMHSFPNPNRHIDQLLLPVLRHDQHKHIHMHDDHDDADDEEEEQQEQYKLKVAAAKGGDNDDIHVNNHSKLFTPTAWSPSPMATGLLASSAMAVAVVASAAAKQLHHNFASAMMNSNPSASSASHPPLPSSAVSASPEEGGPDFIFSPRPFSPALHETRTFGEFYQALKS